MPIAGLGAMLLVVGGGCALVDGLGGGELDTPEVDAGLKPPQGVEMREEADAGSSPERAADAGALDVGAPREDAGHALDAGHQADAEMPEAGAPLACSSTECTLAAGVYLGEMSWPGDKPLHLLGRVQIGDGTPAGASKLLIPPGASIRAAPDVDAQVVISRFSRIEARGTLEEPITFGVASARPTRGQWSGLIIAGNGPASCAPSPGEPCRSPSGVYFGGRVPHDDSGELSFVRLELAGRAGGGAMSGALALLGVGSRTRIENVQVARAGHHGVSLVGGSVNLRQLVVNGAGSDGLVWSHGWNGRAQFVVVLQHGDAGAGGIRGEGHPSDEGAEPASEPLLSNVTVVGRPMLATSGVGLLFASGSRGRVTNSLLTFMAGACVDLEGAATFGHAQQNLLQIDHSVIHCPDSVHFRHRPVADASGPADPYPLHDHFRSSVYRNTIGADPMFTRPFDDAAPDLKPRGGAAMEAPADLGDPFFVRTSYRGAVDPGGTAWMSPWAVF